MRDIHIPLDVMKADGLFLSHSGGKDSQATLAALVRMGFKGRVILVHADLGEMEWQEMRPWIESIAFGIELHVVQAEEDFFDLCRRTGRFPSGTQQYCTDYLKTLPLTKFIHDYMYKHGMKTAVNITGMRSAESKKREKKLQFSLSKGDGTSGMHQPKNHPGHTVYDWMPIKEYSDIEVFAEIAAAGQEPHELYSMGFSRLSCVFCVNGRIGEHKKAAEMRPELALKIANLERELGKALRLKQVKNVKYPKFLDTYTNLPPVFGGCK